MNSKVLNDLQRSVAAKARRSGPRRAAARLGLVCGGVLLAGVLVPRAGLGQNGAPPTVMIPGGGGLGIPQSSISSGPINPWAGPTSSQQPQESYAGGYYGSSAPAPNGSACLLARTFSGVVASDERQVILRFGRDDLYRVRLTKACPALVMKRANVAGVTRSTGGMICNPFDVELKVVAGDGTVSHCTGATLSRVIRAQVAAASDIPPSLAAVARPSDERRTR